MAKYNKSDIMKNAWSMFNNDNFDICDYLYTFTMNEQKTFADCLKEAWSIEKEEVARREREAAQDEVSEEKKAWDWACRKLGVEFDDVTTSQKVTWVNDMAKEAWPGTSVWSLAMRAVKLHIELF